MKLCAKNPTQGFKGCSLLTENMQGTEFILVAILCLCVNK